MQLLLMGVLSVQAVTHKWAPPLRIASAHGTAPRTEHRQRHLVVLVVLARLLGGGVLVLLVLGDEVVHVGLGLGELHLVHTLAGVPVKEDLAPEHGGELLGHALEHLLDGGGPWVTEMIEDRIGKWKSEHRTREAGGVEDVSTPVMCPLRPGDAVAVRCPSSAWMPTCAAR